MKIFKRILIVLAGLLVILQFIRPPRNISDNNAEKNIGAAFAVPPDVREILRVSCYDCHSNSTQYPWYAEVQPVGWWLNSHIQDAKREVNFSEFAGYRVRRQYRKFEDIIDEVQRDDMPLPSYLLIHTDAKLSQERKDRLISWVNSMRDSMKAAYPPDSLVVKRRS